MESIEKINQAKQGSPFSDELVHQLRLELERNKGSWARLARSSGGEITYTWLKLFAAGKINNPSVKACLTLGKFLGVNMKAVPGPHFNRFEG